MPHLRREGAVFVLDLGEPRQRDTENRLTPEFLEQVHTCLDEVEASTGPAALVTTGTGKFWSNGFVPELFSEDYLLSGQRLFARVLLLGLPTVAAVQGHCYAGGAILAAAHDTRVMRADRGFWCLPEVLLGMVVPRGMLALLQARLPAQSLHLALLTGRRYTGPEALEAGLVDSVEDGAAVLTAAVDAAAGLAPTRGDALARTKQRLYGDLAELLRTDAG